MNGKFVKKLFISMATALTLLGSTSAVMAATYTQKSNALSSYNCSKFKYLNNSNYFLKQNFSYSTASGYNNNSHFQMTPDSIMDLGQESGHILCII
ncbi:hypothetical protein [Pediococcus damnosus]|uniref:hypothetical protein n=2 Tax=Pediococcus damnosus TaxID=51663 RepID=UPI0007A062B5|nr:hypothetical protein [Pediococcus damnosus]